MNKQKIKQILEDKRDILLKNPDIQAVGIGYKISKGKVTKELSLVCTVEKKKARSKVSKKWLIPTKISGVNTDVIEGGKIVAYENPREKHRPAPGGVSLGHYLITAGTLGCWVRKDDIDPPEEESTCWIANTVVKVSNWAARTAGRQTRLDAYLPGSGGCVMLSNNHVLAKENEAELGDDIYQPGPVDGGTSHDKIGRLYDYVKIDFSEGGENRVDCAIAAPFFQEDIDFNILQIGEITGEAEADVGMKIQKSGRTTGHTQGTILQTDAYVKVWYGNKQALFVDQLISDIPSAGGDSGSAILDMDNKIVGLLFAGAPNYTIMNRIQPVFSYMGLHL